MSLNCDGAHNLPEDEVSKTIVNGRDGSPVSDFDEENIETEGFRGFEKVPKVLLQRFDITNYSKNNCTPLTGAKNGHNICMKSTLKLDPFVKICCVTLERQNLGKLKQCLSASPRSDISASELNDSMSSYKCKICGKIYASEKKLLNHQENKHMIVYKPKSKPQKRVSFSDHIIVHEVKVYHKCRKCPKIFEDYKSLKAHMKQKHKKRKCYICHYCNKNFVDRMFFKVHLKLHCDVCGTLSPNKSAYVDHRRNVCRVLKMHKCKTCNCSFFKFMDLKDHSYEHLSTFFNCDICKDQFETKCAVAHHISFLHSKKRPTAMYNMRNLGTERLYLCNFCEESSVDRDLIEAHAQALPDLTNRAMTGYKDYYFCDQCLKKFETEQDMLHHKWTHFLKTSDNSQERPKSNTTDNSLNTKYNCNNVPEYMKPQLVLEKLNIDVTNFTSIRISSEALAKQQNKKNTKRTMFSNHKCQTCGKYYSSNYCLNRHIETQHSDYENLRCKVCEETFVWPSLLQSHKCIRLKLPEMPFEDARPEIHFENLNEVSEGFDDYNIMDNDDYRNSIDFEIPAPIVELTEGTNGFTNNVNCMSPIQNLGYKVVMQEVSIEF